MLGRADTSGVGSRGQKKRPPVRDIGGLFGPPRLGRQGSESDISLPLDLLENEGATHHRKLGCNADGQALAVLAYHRAPDLENRIATVPTIRWAARIGGAADQKMRFGDGASKMGHGQLV